MKGSGGVVMLLAALSFGGRELSAAEPTIEEGFVSLFDGKSLAGWTGATDGYRVEDGTLVCLKGSRGNLWAEKEYADFVLRFEFRIPPGGNNGVGVRCPFRPRGSMTKEGMEFQILDNTAKKHANIKPYQYHGSLYGIIAAKRGALKPVGQWNDQEIVLRGSSARVVLNGKTILDADIEEALADGALDGGDHSGARRKRGYLGFLGHGDRVEFRHIRVKALTSANAD